MAKELIHYGTPGMKWGFRKDGKPQGFQYGAKGQVSKLGTGGIKGPARSAEISSKQSERAKAAAANQVNREARMKERASRINANKNRSILSDAEIQKRINRLESEKRLNQLTEEQVTPGRAAVKEFFKTNGTKIASGVALSTIGATITYAVTSSYPSEGGPTPGEAALKTFEQGFKNLVLRKK